MTTDISTTYLGLDLASPLVASSCPLTGRLDTLMRLADAGVGAVVLPSLFEEEVEAEHLAFFDRMEGSAFSEATTQFAPMDLDYLQLDKHLRLVEEASQRLAIPVIASLNGTSTGGWVRYARGLVEAGASAIELNMYDLAVNPALSASEVEQGYVALVRSVCEGIDVPVAVKLSPYFSSIPSFCSAVVGAGAQGLVLFNRFYQPDLDLETLDVTPRLELSHPGELRLPLRWIAILRPQLPGTSLGLTSGVTRGTDVAKALLAGSDVAMSASELLRQGPERARGIIEELTQWMGTHDYVSVRQLKGSVAQHSVSDPGLYERAQYQRVLASWRA